MLWSLFLHLNAVDGAGAAAQWEGACLAYARLWGPSPGPLNKQTALTENIYCTYQFFYNVVAHVSHGKRTNQIKIFQQNALNSREDSALTGCWRKLFC